MEAGDLLDSVKFSEGIKKPSGQDRTAADGNYVAEATRRRRRISQARFFLYLQTKPQYMILITFKTDFFQKNILKIWRKK
jgi:hypothetical protein